MYQYSFSALQTINKYSFSYSVRKFDFAKLLNRLINITFYKNKYLDIKLSQYILAFDIRLEDLLSDEIDAKSYSK